jgi:hypothetical protein
MDLVVARFDPARPDPELVLMLADSALEEARRQAQDWTRQHWGVLRGSAAFVVGLVASPQAETRAFAREQLRTTAIPDAEAQSLVARLVAVLHGLGAGEGARAVDIGETMRLAFQPALRRIGEPVLRDLIAHPLAEVQRLGGELILGHDTLAQHPPPDLLGALLGSPHAEVRAVGARILAQLGDALLKENAEALAALVRHEHADLRAEIRPTIRRLAAGDAAFGRRIAGLLIEAMLVPGAPEGVPSHTAAVLREDLRGLLDQVPAATVLRLLHSRSGPAQEIGGLLLATNVPSADLSVAELVRLASHDVLAVREAVWRICRAHPERLRAEPETAARLADAKWEDSRRFAATLFRDGLADAAWTPALLVSICDSVRPDVQQLGRELIAARFREQDGLEYALKLSEHPDPSLQAFASDFLDHVHVDDPEEVQRLAFYCNSVLARVNRCRVAKQRVFAFLERASQAGEGPARVVAEILARYSLTAAVSHRARAIEILTFIHQAHPSIKLPIRVRTAEVRHGV